MRVKVKTLGSGGHPSEVMVSVKTMEGRNDWLSAVAQLKAIHLISGIRSTIPITNT